MQRSQAWPVRVELCSFFFTELEKSLLPVVGGTSSLGSLLLVVVVGGAGCASLADRLGPMVNSVEFAVVLRGPVLASKGG